MIHLVVYIVITQIMAVNYTGISIEYTEYHVLFILLVSVRVGTVL